MTILVIVPCGKAKIWDGTDRRDPVKAKKVYTGSLFRLNRSYAEKFSDRWVILSAKYGLIDPDERLTPYDVTFNNPTSETATLETLKTQIEELRLLSFSKIIGLGGKEYRRVLKEVFSLFDREVEFPFAGLDIFALTKALKRVHKKKGFGV